MIGQIILGIIAVIVLLIVLPGTLFTVGQQTVAIVERFGKFRKVAGAGLNVKVPFIDRVAVRMPLRIQQMDVRVETKTKDNVFTALSISVQLGVIPERVTDAWYKLTDATKQVEAYVFDAVRAKVPTLSLDEVFEKKDDIATQVNQDLSEEMASFGYTIVKTLVTDVEPDESVKKAMNAINAARRTQEAATAQGEADKIKVVKAAEAEAESKRLQGVGIAAQRKAIATGLRESIEDIREGIGAETADPAMQMLLMTQYFDTLNSLGKAGSTTILLPGSPSGVADIGAQIRDAVLTGNIAAKDATHPAPKHVAPEATPAE